MGELLQLWIAVGRQHLRVGVYVDAPALGLLQQLIQVLQVVAGHHDEGPSLDVHVHPGGLRGAEAPGVGPVQQGHALQVHLAELHDQGQPLLHSVLLRQGAQPFDEPAGHLRVVIAQAGGVVGVGRHALHAEQQGGAEGDDVRLPLPQGEGAAEAPAPQLGGLVLRPARKVPDGGVVKVHIGQGGEQPVRQQAQSLAVRRSGGLGRLGQADQGLYQAVLEQGSVRLLAAYAHLGAALAPGGLLALETEHIRHKRSPPISVVGE